MISYFVEAKNENLSISFSLILLLCPHIQIEVLKLVHFPISAAYAKVHNSVPCIFCYTRHIIL